MKGIAAMALAFGLTATPVLAAGQSASADAPVRLSDGELDQVTAGDLLGGLNLGGLIQGLGQALGNNLGLNIGLSAGPISASAGLQANTSSLLPLLNSVTGLTGQLIQQGQSLAAGGH